MIKHNSEYYRKAMEVRKDYDPSLELERIEKKIEEASKQGCMHVSYAFERPMRSWKKVKVIRVLEDNGYYIDWQPETDSIFIKWN